MEDSAGVVALEGTPLWDILDEAESIAAGAFAPAASAPIIMPAALAETEMGNDPPAESIDLGVTQTEVPMPATTADAQSYLRSLMVRADPAAAPDAAPPAEIIPAAEPAGVESPPEAGGDAQRIVNPAARSDVPVGDMLAQARTALATPGLTQNQREGITRHFLSQVEEELLAPPDASDLQAVLRSMVAPIMERLDRIERSLDDTAPAQRRSLTPRPQRDETPRPYAPKSIRSLAEGNTV
jgi:hypothetical protein